MGCLYQIEFPNGKSYIGITSKTAEARFKEHCGEARGRKGWPLHRALSKHGVESAAVRTLVVADDWKYLCDLERRAIAAFGTYHSGYNATLGGDGASPGSAWHKGHKHSDAAKAKMSAAKKGKKRTVEAIEKSRVALLGNKYNLGRHVSEETKCRMSLSNIARAESAPRASSGVTGVSFCQCTGKWRAIFRGRTLGRFGNIVEAKEARQRARAAHVAEVKNV